MGIRLRRRRTNRLLCAVLALAHRYNILTMSSVWHFLLLVSSE